MIVYPGLIFLRLIYFTLGLIFERPETLGSLWAQFWDGQILRLNFWDPSMGPGVFLGGLICICVPSGVFPSSRNFCHVAVAVLCI